MSADILAVLDRYANRYTKHDGAELRAARQAVADVIAERDALRKALDEYPKRNPHQLQARKVCEGVAALASDL